MLKEQLYNYIEDNGIKRVWVAQQLGISRQYLTNYLKGHVKASAEVESRVAEFLRERGALK